MKRLINFLIINTMIGIGHISSNDKCHDLVLLNNQCLLTLPGAGETTSPLHVIRSDELYSRLKIITNLKKIDNVANLSRL